ncbi:glycosyltransferase family 2 protein [Halovivax limisalsi]|uniref:glycosyltransferase family 2 protein n=1 Tax=Halovivax limisalsi TaxID=1453760 RepID=UPI001FFC7D03|nr:glycosyltransferase family 2 protein [Halovivax limisalsi]
MIPTHDRPDGLRRAVDSVLAQTHDPVEVVVVDDASRVPARDVLAEAIEQSRTDGVGAPIERFEVVRFESNRGGAAARNAGIEAASGAYVAFLDDDDRWDPAKLDRQVDRLEAAPAGVGVCYTGVVQVGDSGGRTAVSRPTHDGDLTKTLLVRNVVGTISSVVIRREVVETVGGLDERFPSWQDWAYYLRCSDAYRFCAVREPLTIRHNAGDQLSGDYRTKRAESAPLFRREFGPVATRYGPSVERAFEAAVDYHLGLAAIRADEYGAARRHFLAALRRNPRRPVVACYLLAVAGGRVTYETLYRLDSVLPIRRLKRALRE